jgi:hypothetical protein
MTRIYHGYLDRCIGHFRSLAATLIGSTAASRRLVVVQHPCYSPSYVTTSIIIDDTYSPIAVHRRFTNAVAFYVSLGIIDVFVR